MNNKATRMVSFAAVFAFAAAAQAANISLVSGRYCFFEGTRLSEFDKSLTFVPVLPKDMVDFYDGASLPSYEANPPAGWAIDKWAIIPFVDVNTATNFNQVSPLAVYTANSAETSAGGYIVKPKWKTALSEGGIFLDLCPCYKWLTYTLKYVINDGNGEDSDTPALRRTGLVYTNNVMLADIAAATSRWSRTHYELLGFSTNAAATKADFKFGEAIVSNELGWAGDRLGATTNGTVVLYGVWKYKAEQYAVKLERGGDALEGDTSVVATYGEPLPAAVMPSRRNYSFDGYWLGGTQYYDANGVCTSKWNIERGDTLVARWKRFEVSLAFVNGDGAIGGQPSVTAQVGAALPGVKPPVRAGWVFAGYWSHSVGGTQYYDEDGAGCIDWAIPANTRLYAHWTPIEYKIFYDWNGGTAGAEAPGKALYPVPFAVSVPVREGFEFTGFAPSGDAASTNICAYADDAPFIVLERLSDVDGGMVKLTAQWKAKASVKTLARASAGASAADLEKAADANTNFNFMAEKASDGKWVADDTWQVDEAEYKQGDSSIKKESVGLSRLTATVKGSGTLSFWWKYVPEEGGVFDTGIAFATNMPMASLSKDGSGLFTEDAKACIVPSMCPSAEDWKQEKIVISGKDESTATTFHWSVDYSGSATLCVLHIDNIVWTAKDTANTEPDPGPEPGPPEPSPAAAAKPVVEAHGLDCIGEYDGKVHTIEVLTNPAIANTAIKYSLSKEGPFVETAPAFVNATNAATVWFEVSAEGYAASTNSAKVTILKARNGWVVAPKITGRVEGRKYDKPQVEALYGDVSVSYSPGGAVCPTNVATNVVATFSVPAGKNYEGIVTNIAFDIARISPSGGGETDGEPDSPINPPVPDLRVAFTNSAEYAKAQTVVSALYCKPDDKFAGTVQVKFGKVSKSKKTVKVSASAKLLNGKSVSAKAVSVRLSEDGMIEGVLVFKDPIGSMAFAVDDAGTGVLYGEKYEVRLAGIGGDLAANPASGTFRLDEGFDLAVTGVLQKFLLPGSESFSIVRGKWKFKGNSSVKIVRDKATKERYLSVDYGKNDAKTNESSLKLSYTSKTGLFKGSFCAYSTYTTSSGVLKLKKYTIKVSGFVVDGVGEGEATCTNPKGGPWRVTVE